MLLFSQNLPSYSKKQCDAFDFGSTHVIVNIKATKNWILNEENIQYSLKNNAQHQKFNPISHELWHPSLEHSNNSRWPGRR